MKVSSPERCGVVGCTKVASHSFKNEKYFGLSFNPEEFLFYCPIHAKAYIELAKEYFNVEISLEKSLIKGGGR